MSAFEEPVVAVRDSCRCGAVFFVETPAHGAGEAHQAHTRWLTAHEFCRTVAGRDGRDDVVPLTPNEAAEDEFREMGGEDRDP